MVRHPTEKTGAENATGGAGPGAALSGAAASGGIKHFVWLGVAFVAGGAGGAAVLATTIDHEDEARSPAQQLVSQQSTQDSQKERANSRSPEVTASERQLLERWLAVLERSRQESSARDSEEGQASEGETPSDAEQAEGRSAAEILIELERAYRRTLASEEESVQAEETEQELTAATQEDVESEPAYPESEPAYPEERTAEPSEIAFAETSDTPAVAGDEARSSQGRATPHDPPPPAQTTNNIVVAQQPVYVVQNPGQQGPTQSPAARGTSTQARVRAGQDDGTQAFIDANLTARQRSSSVVFQPTPVHRFFPARQGDQPRPRPGTPQSAHGRSPWDSTDYTHHHNPWGTSRIP